MRPAGGDDLAGAIPPTKTEHVPPTSSVRQSPKAPDEQTLLHELWQISHFGWIPEAAILRSLSIAGQVIPTVALDQLLRQLLDRGWVQPRDSDAHTGEREWRLTDTGRNTR